LFLEAAVSAKYEIETHFLPGLTGPEGESLSCDIAIKSRSTSDAVVTTSGIHGVEGYAGSMLQTSWIKNAALLPDGPDIIHVHMLNPYGAAYMRRADHRNNDVNRNFMSRWPVDEPNVRYATYADVIVPKQDGGLLPSLVTQARLIAAQVIPGQAVMKDIITQGQYSDPKGMYYGGSGPSWSRKIWEGTINRILSKYQRVCHLDIHTGLGRTGELQAIASPRSSRALEFAKAVWGQTPAPLHGEGKLLKSSPITGDINDFWDIASGPKPGEAISITLEFGTRAAFDVFRALQADHIAYAQNVTDPERLSRVRGLMREAFSPSDPVWASQVLQAGTQAYQNALSVFSRHLIK
jgi:hypothetical protein